MPCERYRAPKDKKTILSTWWTATRLNRQREIKLLLPSMKCIRAVFSVCSSLFLVKSELVLVGESDERNQSAPLRRHPSRRGLARLSVCVLAIVDCNAPEPTGCYNISDVYALLFRVRTSTNTAFNASTAAMKARRLKGNSEHSVTIIYMPCARHARLSLCTEQHSLGSSFFDNLGLLLDRPLRNVLERD